MSIRDMEMLGIGRPDDVGGTETAGTVMAKENAIMQMMKDYGSQVKNNMILKQTPTKTLKTQGATFLNFDFDFGKPVRIIGIQIRFSPAVSSYPEISIPVYIINGEDSFSTHFTTKFSALGIFCRFNNSSIGFYGTIGSNGSSYANSFDPISDIWATRLTLQFNANYANEEVSSYVVYQEQGEAS